MIGIDSRYRKHDEMMRKLVGQTFGVVQRLRADIEGRGARFYVAYLPAAENLRAQGVDPYETLLMERLSGSGIKVFNFEKYLRARQADPLSIFPFRLGGHYLSEGYSLVADQIYDGVGEDLRRHVPTGR